MVLPNVLEGPPALPQTARAPVWGLRGRAGAGPLPDSPFPSDPLASFPPRSLALCSPDPGGSAAGLDVREGETPFGDVLAVPGPHCLYEPQDRFVHTRKTTG